MRGTGKAVVCVSAVVLVLAAVVVAGAAAQQAEHKAPRAVAADGSDLAFLEVGKTYFIQFAPGADPFVFKTDEFDPPEGADFDSIDRLSEFVVKAAKFDPSEKSPVPAKDGGNSNSGSGVDPVGPSGIVAPADDGGNSNSGSVTASSRTTMTYRVPAFTVKKLGRGSWALLEYPLDVKAATVRSMARLVLMNKEMLAEEAKTEDGRKQIAAWKKKAEEKVNTTESWVNLAHAINIAPPIVDPKDPRLQATISVSVEVK